MDIGWRRRRRRRRGAKRPCCGPRAPPEDREAGARDAIYSGLEWVPLSRGWRDPLYRGDGYGVLVHGEKREGYRGSAGEGFIPYMTIFCIGKGIGKLLKLL
jgi:hypothetical protein